MSGKNIEIKEEKQIPVVKDNVASNNTEKQEEQFVERQVEIVTKEAEKEKIVQKETEKLVVDPTGQSKKPVANVNRQFRVGFTVIGGVSNNVTSFPVLGDEKALRDAFSSSVGTTSQTASPIPVSDKFSSTASFGLGAFAERSLSKKLSIHVGLTYHQYNAVMKVGVKVDSARTVREARWDNTANVSSFYRAGQSTSYKNRYHLLELPVNMQWQLNKSDNKPISIYAGLMPSILFSSNSLLYNQQQGLYYKEHQQYKQLQLFTQAGIMFPIANNNRYSYQVGPTFHYGITNLTKQAVGTNEHLIFLGLKANILFNKNNSKK